MKQFLLQRDAFDEEDYVYRSNLHPSAPLPSSLDLRCLFPPITNQGNLGSCALNAATAYLEFLQMQKLKVKNRLSRLFLYWNVRKRMNTLDLDSGCTLRDVVKSLNKEGVCSESLWRYFISWFKKEPSTKCYEDALTNTISSYERISPLLQELKTCIADGNPVFFGIMIYQSMMSKEVELTGIVPMPDLSEPSKGGHAMLIVGYDDEKKAFAVRNSWGKNWGIKGYCYMPYAYVCNNQYAFDFWKMSI